MKKNNIKTLIFFILTLFLASCEKDKDNGNNDGNTKRNLTLINEIAYANLSEIDLGQLAVNKATNANVTAYGQLMIQEHQKAENELDSLAKSRNITLPTTTNADKQRIKDTLNTLAGAAFDSAYIQSQILVHTQTREMFEAISDSTTDEGLKAYLNKHLPKVQLHLQKADSVAMAL